MIEQVITFDQGYWIPDPQKLAAAGWFSAVMPDRIGPDDIKKAIMLTNTSEYNWEHYVQEETSLSRLSIGSVLEDFAQIGSKFYLNQFVEHNGNIAFWMPEFSEFSVIMFRKGLYRAIKEYLLDINKELSEWIGSDFWTDGERKFIVDGVLKYTVLPTV